MFLFVTVKCGVQNLIQFIATMFNIYMQALNILLLVIDKKIVVNAQTCTECDSIHLTVSTELKGMAWSKNLKQIARRDREKENKLLPSKNFKG